MYTVAGQEELSYTNFTTHELVSTNKLTRPGHKKGPDETRWDKNRQDLTRKGYKAQDYTQQLGAVF
jgi:hypothetical protein